MPSRSRSERLFGAACLKAQLERAGVGNSGASSIYDGILIDLGLDDEEVSAYLIAHRTEVDEALAKARRPKEPGH